MSVAESPSSGMGGGGGVYTRYTKSIQIRSPLQKADLFWFIWFAHLANKVQQSLVCYVWHEKRLNDLSLDMWFPTMWHFWSVDSDQTMQPSVKLRNSKWCSVSSLTLIEYSSDLQRLWSDCAYAQACLSLCWSHIPHFWKSHALAHMFPWISSSVGQLRVTFGRKSINDGINPVTSTTPRNTQKNP